MKPFKPKKRSALQEYNSQKFKENLTIAKRDPLGRILPKFGLKKGGYVGKWEKGNPKVKEYDLSNINPIYVQGGARNRLGGQTVAISDNGELAQAKLGQTKGMVGLRRMLGLIERVKMPTEKPTTTTTTTEGDKDNAGKDTKGTDTKPTGTDATDNATVDLPKVPADYDPYFWDPMHRDERATYDDGSWRAMEVIPSQYKINWDDPNLKRKDFSDNKVYDADFLKRINRDPLEWEDNKDILLASSILFPTAAFATPAIAKAALSQSWRQRPDLWQKIFKWAKPNLDDVGKGLGDEIMSAPSKFPKLPSAPSNPGYGQSGPYGFPK